MLLGSKHRRRFGGGALLLTLLAVLGPGAAGASAAGVPVIAEAWAFSVFSGTARLSAEVNPSGLCSSYHVDYIAKAAYEANVAAGRDPFTGAVRSPSSQDANVLDPVTKICSTGSALVTVQAQLSALSADTAYRYRFVAKNGSGTTIGGTFTFATQAIGGASILLDSRGWEMVSPVGKNGGQVAAPGTLAGGGVSQAAAGGGAIAYGSAASFGEGAVGAATASQYLAVRGLGGWSTQNVTAPLYSASYNTEAEGVPYQLFSTDLARGLLLNGRRCRGEGTGCAVPNSPLAGTDAPAGYQDYYLREGSGYTALLGAANAGFLAFEPSQFELRLAGSSPDLLHTVLSTCAALSADATEVPLGGSCDPAQANLYEYSPGAGLGLVNLLPGETHGTPGAILAAQAGAVSAGGSRVYFTDGGSLYLREGAQTKLLEAGGEFQTASADGSVAYYSRAGHLYRYEAAGAGSSTDLTPSGGVVGVLGTSEAGAYVYYQDGSGLRLWHSGTTTTVAAGAGAASPGDYPPTTGAARVSADGAKLLFVSSASLTGYDNKDLGTGNPDSEIFLYDAGGGGAPTCISCNPTFERPVGPSTIPGAVANGTAPGAIDSYKPRVLSADGRRVVFDSRDAISLADSDGAADVYEWEAQGEGSCTRAGGCVALISGGRTIGGASLVDASADGSDVFFLTDASLVGADPGAVDLYDARVGGGFPEPSKPIACQGDACQSLPSAPTDPTLTTLLAGPGNPAVRYPGAIKKCNKGKVKRKGRCIKKKAKKTNKKKHKRGTR